MLTSIIVRIINFCTRHAWSVIAAGILLSIVSGLFAAKHFAINSEINTLLSAELPWRKREVAFEKAFSRFESIIVVVNAPTAELADIVLPAAAWPERTITIVGIDETDTARGRVSWISPIAKALLKAEEGDVVKLRTPTGIEELEIVRVAYGQP